MLWPDVPALPTDPPEGIVELMLAHMVYEAAHERGQAMVTELGVSDDEWVDWCIMVADLGDQLGVVGP